MKTVLKSDAAKEVIEAEKLRVVNDTVRAMLDHQKTFVGKVTILPEEIVLASLSAGAVYDPECDLVTTTITIGTDWQQAGEVPGMNSAEIHVALEGLLDWVSVDRKVISQPLGLRQVHLPRFDGATIVYLPEEQEVVEAEFGRYVEREV